MTYVVKRDGQSLLSSLKQDEGDFIDRTLDKIADIILELKKNDVSFTTKIVNWLLKAPDEFVVMRRKTFDVFGKTEVYAEMRRHWWKCHRYLSAREKVLGLFTVPMIMVMVALSLILTVYPPSESRGMDIPALEIVWDYGDDTSLQPVNWLDGIPESNGFNKDALTGPYTYAKDAGYTFAANQGDVDKMISSGQLVKLESEHIKLIDVSQPYVMPVVADFTTRLATLYESKGCGQLFVTSALRTHKVQGALANGSKRSVHPTGMSVDLRWYPKKEKGGKWCQEWLNDTLLEIEADRRIDVTIEKNPRHFHVVVVPHEYERYLAAREGELSPEVKSLALGMLFEGGPNESDAGLQAIAAVMKNRRDSSEFPNTIVGVVAHGAAGRSAGGCQFSFMCDGKAENIQVLCDPANKKDPIHWEKICEARWERMVTLAKRFINDDTDPTGGAVLYYSKSMRKKPPYWAKDMRRGTIKEIDGHIFGCSVNLGKGVCKKPKGVLS